MARVAMIPAISAREDLCHLLARIAPYLAVAETPPEIHCSVVDGSPAEEATTADLEAVFPPFMNEWTHNALPALMPHVHYHPMGEGADWLHDLRKDDLLLLHEAEFLLHLSPSDRNLLAAVLARGVRLCNLTMELNPYASMDLARCVRPWDTTSPEEERGRLLEVLDRVRSAATECATSGPPEVLALGSGSSIFEDIHWRNVTLSPRTPALISNALIREAAILKHLKGPIIACFMDVMLVGSSNVAEHYIADLIEFLDARPNTWIATSEFCAPMLRPRLPKAFWPRILSLPFEMLKDPPQPYRLDLFHHTSVVDSWNVVTALVLPLAASLARSIVIGGLDGRANPEREECWSGVTYNETSDDAVKAMWQLPADNSPEFYSAHTASLDRLITQMQAEGWTLRSMTPSFYPAINSLYRKGGR